MNTIFGNVDWNESETEAAWKFLLRANPFFRYDNLEDFKSWLEFESDILWREKKDREFLDWGTMGFSVTIFKKGWRLNGVEKPLRARVYVNSSMALEGLDKLEKKFGEALATDEKGDNLLAVARDAVRAEEELASIQRKENDNEA